MTNSPITPLDNRKQVILKAIVTDYVRTAEPIGSRALMTHYRLGVKSATIRNEMAELAELGYLHQPHTSAGRIPSDRGYRFYVDRLMGAAGLAKTEAESARHKLTPRRAEMDLILEHACKILSDMAHHASVATHPSFEDARISHISVAHIGPGRMLALLVLDSGRVVHEFLDLSSEAGAVNSQVATDFLMRIFEDKTLESASAASLEAEESASLAELFAKVHDFIARESSRAGETDVTTEGAGYMVQQPEFRDTKRLEAVLSVLEQRSALYKLFSSTYLGPGVSVIIGSENPVEQMRDCSFVGSRYNISGRPAGTIGILGPTRMDYRRAVSAVGFMARNLGDLLTSLSVS
ncbi:MAG: heat-inducible transcription repressor HrcA [Armatimonadetes bacterium]|jgi:heat-inducible transcriptional repressor|nr:heat-inducible transcription repressor HrcA [Armatimonadota bacterium]